MYVDTGSAMRRRPSSIISMTPTPATVCAIGRIASTDTNTNAAAADTTRSFIQSSTSNFLLLTSYFLRSPSGTFDVLRVLLVFLADVFHQLLGRTQARVERDGKRLRVV